MRTRPSPTAAPRRSTCALLRSRSRVARGRSAPRSSPRQRPRRLLHRAVANVSGGEHAADGRLERQRAVPAPAERLGQLAIGENEAVRVEQHAVSQPGGGRSRADEAEQARAGQRLLRTPAEILQRDLLETVPAIEALNFDTGDQVDPRIGIDPLDQVLRHGLGEAVTPDGDRDATVALGEVDGGLPGGVPASDHQYGRPIAHARLEVGRGVVDAGALEALEVLDGQPLVGRSGGDDHRSRRDLAAVPQDDHAEARLGPQAHDFARSVEASAESHRLDGGSPGEVATGDAIRKAGVVLDSRARPRLATDRDGVQGDGSQTLRGPIHRGGEPGRSAADDHQVEDVAGYRMVGQPEMLRERRRGGTAQDVRGGDHRGDVLRFQPQAREQRVDVLGVLDVDPCVGQMRMLGERPQAHRLGRVARADDADGLGSLARSQKLAPRDERGEHGFRERGPTAHQPAELGLGDHQHPARHRHTAAHGATLAGQQIQLADEAARPVRGDDGRVGAVEAHDLDLALEHDEQVVGRLAGLEQQLADTHRLLGPERGDLRELGGAQHRVGVPAAGAHLRARPTTGSVSWISMSSPHSAHTTRTVVRCPQGLCSNSTGGAGRSVQSLPHCMSAA